jgi:WhiB family redox-sensing transcriptional regulator
MTAQRWRERAACRGAGPALFYDLHPTAIDAAKQVCAGCPVRAACAHDAEQAGEEYGVWGGGSADERLDTSRRGHGPGPVAAVSDDELRDLFDHANPTTPAVVLLLERFDVPRATAYKYLARAERLGVVEHRGRALYPARP